MLSIRAFARKCFPLIMTAFVLLITTSCSLNNTNAAETEISIEEYTTAVPIEFSYGKYYLSDNGLQADVYLEITEDTIALKGSDTDIRAFWEYLWTKDNVPVDEIRLAELTAEWKKPREYIVQNTSMTFIAWEWAHDEAKTMVSGGHFEDETHFVFHSIIFEYKSE